MFSLETTLFGLALVVGSLLLLRWHWRVWQENKQSEREERYQQFLHLQCRRRMQASGMLGVIGLGMLVGQFLDPWPLVKVFHWSGVLLLVLWMLLLATADLIVTRQFFGRVRRDHLMEEMRYHADFRRRGQEEDFGSEEEPGSEGKALE